MFDPVIKTLAPSTLSEFGIGFELRAASVSDIRFRDDDIIHVLGFDARRPGSGF
jgi:hypothetical protein